MDFNFVAFFFNPLVLLFLTMTLGNLFGELKIGKFKFGITGTLFVGHWLFPDPICSGRS